MKIDIIAKSLWKVDRICKGLIQILLLYYKLTYVALQISVLPGERNLFWFQMFNPSQSGFCADKAVRSLAKYPTRLV